jgi:cytochrome P450
MVLGATVHEVPRPRGTLLARIPRLLADPYRFCMDAAAEGDGLVRVALGPVGVYIVSHPDYVHRVLVGNSANYIKGSMMDVFRVALGNGLVTSEGDFWKRQRRLLQPAFHPSQIEKMAELIDASVARAIERWVAAADESRPVILLSECIRLNIEIVLGALFSASVDGERTERLRQLTDQVFLGMTKNLPAFLLPGWLPVPGVAKYRRAIEALDVEVHALIEERRSGGVVREDLLGLLLAAEDAETGERMTDGQIRDEIFTFFMSGYETTATGISWATYLLAEHPEVVARMVDELDEVTGGERLRFTDLPRLCYGKRVIDEAFRLYPAFPIYFRNAVESDRLGPYQVPAQAKIVISPHVTHRAPEFWDDPETFDPDRFRAERFDARARRAYYPFGKGSRICIGERLSMTIAQTVLSALVRRFEFSLAPGAEVVGRYAITNQPKDGLPLVLRRRDHA